MRNLLAKHASASPTGLHRTLRKLLVGSALSTTALLATLTPGIPAHASSTASSSAPRSTPADKVPAIATPVTSRDDKWESKGVYPSQDECVEAAWDWRMRGYDTICAWHPPLHPDAMELLVWKPK
ncbi:hypothetical protein ACH35V_32395 [Actinomadura sp. 1N219]|uniref:hypothetical protein n=1 Tax=Actinomadura sp. 1N219 TaxID=3375152 RepID=UPI00379EE5BA